MGVALEQSVGCRAGWRARDTYLHRGCSSRQRSQARQMAQVSSWDSTGHTVPHLTLYFAVSWLHERCHPHDCIVTATLLPPISTHCENIFQFPSLLIICWFHFKLSASWWRQRGPLISSVSSSHSVRGKGECLLESFLVRGFLLRCVGLAGLVSLRMKLVEYFWSPKPSVCRLPITHIPPWRQFR